MEKLKGLMLTVLVAEGHKSCGGKITRNCKNVILVGKGVPEIHEATADCPAVKLITWGDGFRHLEPVEPVPAGMVGYMAGGAFAYSCDSRFSKAVGVLYPVSLHDRYDTQEDYNALTR